MIGGKNESTPPHLTPPHSAPSPFPYCYIKVVPLSRWFPWWRDRLFLTSFLSRAFLFSVLLPQFPPYTPYPNSPIFMPATMLSAESSQSYKSSGGHIVHCWVSIESAPNLTALWPANLNRIQANYLTLQDPLCTLSLCHSITDYRSSVPVNIVSSQVNKPAARNSPY